MKTAARNLRLLRVGDAAHGKPKRLRNHGQNHSLLLGDNRLVGGSNRPQPTARATREGKRPLITSAAVRLGCAMDCSQINRPCLAAPYRGRKVEKYHLTGLDITRAYRTRQYRRCPIAEQHFAALFGALIARLEFRVDHIEPGIAQIFGLFIETTRARTRECRKAP